MFNHIILDVWNHYNVVPISSSASENNGFVSKLLFGNRSFNMQRDERNEFESETMEFGEDSSENFHYWARGTQRWPNLSNMAKDLLSIPTTSAACERAFSTGKAVFGLSSMSLKPDTVESLICLRSWYRAKLIDDVDLQEISEEIDSFMQSA